jgi:D-alanine--poly(phosphoribitol) ligase subunit 2
VQSRPEYQVNIAQEIEKLCVDKLSIRVRSADQDLFESGLLDSLSLVQLILELERHYQVELPLEELDISALKTINEMAQLISVRQADALGSKPKLIGQLAHSQK